MRLHKNTNRQYSWPVLIVVCLLIVIVTLAVKLWPRTVPFDQCSAIYRHYAGIEGVDASFIKDFRVNDSVFIDVTLLEAKDSAGWALLCKDFAISDVVKVMQHIDKDIIISRQVSKDDYTQVLESYTPDAEMLAFSYVDKEISIFHTNNEKELHAVYYHNFDESTFNN